jgi:myosin-5
MQSCLRRRLARKQLKALREEARSASRLKEISYRLENKVVELTQNLQKRTAEAKELQSKLVEMETQLRSWMTKHEDADNRARQNQMDIQSEISKAEAAIAAKLAAEKKMEEIASKVAEKDEMISKLTNDLSRQTLLIEEKQKAAAATSSRDNEDISVITTLKGEVNSLREQLNRANALIALTRGGRQEPPLSPTFAPTLRQNDGAALSNGAAHPPSNAKRHWRRHSSAGTYALDGATDSHISDELMLDAKRSQLNNPRAVSMLYNPNDGFPKNRRHGLPSIYDDPVDEKIRLLEDARRLEEDTLEGLIKGLKIPAASTSNPPPAKEILFPANIISLVTNEMWKYGLIAESERFLANVMQHIQSHVIVSKQSSMMLLPLGH